MALVVTVPLVVRVVAVVVVVAEPLWRCSCGAGQAPAVAAATVSRQPASSGALCCSCEWVSSIS